MAGTGVFFAVAATAAIFFVSSPAASAAVGDESRHAVAAAVDDVAAHYGLPGIAVGVVVDGEVRQVELRGEAVVGSGQAITADTLFKIASNTKAMTAALLARQVDAGLLAWDDPVVKHLPAFRMHEAWVTREMQVRDLLIHNSGLGPGAGDLMLWPEPNAFTREDVIAGLAHLKPRWSFRSRYAYDNTLYIVAGEVAAAAGAAPYDVLLRREVFEPLGMDGCRVGEWRLDQAGAVAAPHGRQDGRWIARPDGPLFADMPMAAAGGVRCSLHDMLRWVQAWLDPRTAGTDGRPWLSAAQRSAVWTAHMPMPLTQRMRDWNRSHYSAYGYGWRLSDVDGTAKVAHTGTLSGMYSAVTLLPELGVGYVILVNGDAGDARTVLEQTLGKQFSAPQDRRDVAHYVQALVDEAAPRDVAGDTGGNAEGEPAYGAARQPVAVAPAPAWLGRYRDPWFGEVTVCPSGDGVRFSSARSPRLSGPVLQAGGRLLVDFDTLGADADAWLDVGDDTGGKPALRMAKVDPEADFSYDYEDLAFAYRGACEPPAR